MSTSPPAASHSTVSIYYCNIQADLEPSLLNHSVGPSYFMAGTKPTHSHPFVILSSVLCFSAYIKLGGEEKDQHSICTRFFYSLSLCWEKGECRCLTPQQEHTTEVSFVTSSSLPMFLWISSRQSAWNRLWLTCSHLHLWDQLLGGISSLWWAGAASSQLLLCSEVSRSCECLLHGEAKRCSASSRVSQPLLRWECSRRCKSGAPAYYQRWDFSCMKGRYSSFQSPT